jgi:hypothetical protein
VNLYLINFSNKKPALIGNWQSVEWKNAEIAGLDYVRPEGSGFAPLTKVKLLYTAGGISGIFLVHDQYVKCTRTTHMESVWNDSCVEFFVKPHSAKGYFNFEFNCIGTMYASYILNPERTEGGFKDFIPFKKEDCSKVKIFSSLAEPVNPENNEPSTWVLQFFIPFSLLEEYSEKTDWKNINEWSCNFYKCADESSHPHWISWSPVKDLNFHAPESFGKLLFQKI